MINYLTLRQFAINFGLMNWKSSQIESEERVLVYALWRILNTKSEKKISVDNLQKIMIIILRLPIHADFDTTTNRGSFTSLSLPEDEGIQTIMEGEEIKQLTKQAFWTGDPPKSPKTVNSNDLEEFL